MSKNALVVSGAPKAVLTSGLAPLALFGLQEDRRLCHLSLGAELATVKHLCVLTPLKSA